MLLRYGLIVTVNPNIYNVYYEYEIHIIYLFNHIFSSFKRLNFSKPKTEFVNVINKLAK